MSKSVVVKWFNSQDWEVPSDNSTVLIVRRGKTTAETAVYKEDKVTHDGLFTVEKGKTCDWDDVKWWMPIPVNPDSI